MKLITICALALSLFGVTASPLRAQDAPETAPTRIARGASRGFELPTLPADKPVYLAITSRLDAKVLSGSNFLMALSLNGKPVEAMKAPDATRLKNRALHAPITATLKGDWFGAKSGWRVLYAPDFEKARAVKYYQGDPYVLVLDVSDLVTPGQMNTLEITNTATERTATAVGTAGDLVVQSVAVSDVPDEKAPNARNAVALAAPATPDAAPAPKNPPVTDKTETKAAPLPQGKPLTEMSVGAAPLTIARDASKTVEFGTVPQENTTVLLEITSRLDAKTLAGSNFMLRLTLNGQEVIAAKTRLANRLVNRALDSPVTPTISAPWFGAKAGWRVLYAPDSEGARKLTYYQGDPYTLVLDVTDLVNPAAENRLEISNTASARSAQAAQTEGDLIVQKLTVATYQGASPMMASAAAVAPFINRGARAGGPAKYAAQVLPGGGFVVNVGARQWKFDSAFSFPNAGFNRLLAQTAPDKTGQQSWKVTTQTSPEGGQVTASSTDYQIRRVVRFTPRKIEVADAITNSLKTPLGLIVRDEVSLDGLEGPVVRLAGNSDPALNDYYSPGNPSVHITAPDHTLALLCEDDVFRSQARLYVRPASTGEKAVAGLRTEMLRLAPGETYTLRWSVYPVASQDYFDFVNLVRADWNANLTAVGAWWWGFNVDAVLAMPLDELRAKLERQGIRYATIGGGWIDRTKDPKRIGFGAGVMDDYWADYRRRVREAGDKLRQAAPGIKVLAYYDTQRDTSEGGHERFKDSWLTGPDGAQLSTEWSGQFSLTYNTVATLGNSYGQAMLQVADRYLDEMKLDGLYWDEMENTSFGAPLFTYNMPDGHSCLLDPKTYAIQREIGLTTLLGQGHRLAVVDLVQKRGGGVLGNGPTTGKELLATGIQRMVESQHNDHWSYEGNLQTPLGYISSYTQWENYVRLFNLAMLPVAIGIDQPHDITRHLFPFTPLELHSGYLLGKERIVTTHDGNYGWDGPFRYRLWVYDDTGKTREDAPAWQDATGRVAVTVPAGGAAVMERELN